MDNTKFIAYIIPIIYLTLMSITWSSKDPLNTIIKVILTALSLLVGFSLVAVIKGDEIQYGALQAIPVIVSSLVALAFMMSKDTNVYAIFIKTFGFVSILSTIIYFTV